MKKAQLQEYLILAIGVGLVYWYVQRKLEGKGLVPQMQVRSRAPR